MKLSITETVIANFEQQLELQTTLQDETKRLRTFILKRQLDEISGVTHRIDEISGKIEQIELERRTNISNEQGNSAAQSFVIFLRATPDRLKDRLNAVYLKLKATANETYRLNAGNRILLEEALSSVKSTVAILTRSERASTGYDFNGKYSSVNRKKLLNRIG